MKRIVCILLTVTFLFFITACSGLVEDTKDKKPVVVLPASSEVVSDTTSTEQVSSTTSMTVSSEEDVQERDIIFVGNKSSKVFHKETCKSVSKMKSENMISFKTIKEAKETGYKPCGNCLKDE